MSSKTYKKRPGTSGIQGQLYETKLLSLIYFRALHDDNIDQIYLATNRDDMGAFDDIGFRAKVNDFDKPIAVFIQAKHRENDKVFTLNSKNDLAKYFDSYLDIRRAFKPGNKDVIFDGKFEDIECCFVMYTTAKDDPNNNTYDGKYADFLNELIGTGDACTQPSYKDADLDFLSKIIMKKQVTDLAEELAKFICDESDNEMSMNNDLILHYHVILALKVFHVTDIQSEGYRIASFREDFFTTNEEFLVIIKNILCLEVVKKLKAEECDAQSLITKFLNDPLDVSTLSKLLGSVLTYKNGKLEFITKSITDDLKRQLDKENVFPSTVHEAAKMAAKEYLLSRRLKVSHLFGNKDLAIRGDVASIKKRLYHLTSKVVDLIQKVNSDNIVTIDESMGDGFLKLNGGLSCAVGNILVLDESSKLLKFTDNTESLGKLAKTWYEILKSKVENLHEYKLDIKIKKFPKLSFERGEYDADLVRGFYDKLLLYTNQADQKGVEEILRREIEDHPCSDVNNFRVRSDVIFLKYHDEIQKLWMTPKVGTYLTKKSKIYESTVTNAMSEPLIGVLNMMYKIKNKEYIFNKNALDVLKSYDEIQGTVIATESCILTTAKVEQYLGNKDHAVFDLEYIFKLSLKNHSSLCKELAKSKEKIHVIVCNNFQDSRNSCKRLEDIAKAVEGKQIIIVTNEISVDIITEYFLQARNVLKDRKTILTDLSAESQKKLYAMSKVNFQGEELNLDVVMNDESIKLIDEDVLNKIINNETIIIGKTIIDSNYDKTKHFYIERRVSRIKRQENDNLDDINNKVLETLYDLEDDVVLITALPGMGKSTLLTHLALKTKELDPKVWCVRINLLEHTGKLSKWQENKTVIDTLESLKFICKAAIDEESDRFDSEDEVIIELEEINGTVSLKLHPNNNPTVFQIKMFLHYYNNRKLIFLFDGFDEIFPHYANEALSLLKAVKNYPQRHKIWITSRSFNHIKSILEEEFGPSYELEHFSRLEQDTYLNTYWKSKIKFKKLSREQLENVKDFIQFIQKRLPDHLCVHSKVQHKPYFKVYLNFLEYLKLESVATGTDFDYAEYNGYMMRYDLHKSVITQFANEFIAPPLHLYLLAEYFHNKINDVEKVDKKWDIDVTGYIFYEYYLETKLKKIRFQEKNKIDVFKPDNKIAYEKERVECLVKHKKLGAYAIFYPYLNIFDENELQGIEDMIEELKDGRDKTGLIRTVAENIPLFVHMSFAEYFAVEYVCDLLKSDENQERQEKLWNFVINVMFRKCDMNIFDTFNTKLKMDDTLSSIAENNKEIIFKILYEQQKGGVVFRWSNYEKVDKVDRGIDYNRTDRYILMVSIFSHLFDTYILEDDCAVDFERFFEYFYLIYRDGRFFAVKA